MDRTVSGRGMFRARRPSIVLGFALRAFAFLVGLTVLALSLTAYAGI